jgi:hypothetical protein
MENENQHPVGRPGIVRRTTAERPSGADDVFNPDYTVTSTTDGGDPLLTNVEVIVIFWGSYWSNTSPAPDISPATYYQAFTGIVTGPFMSRLSQYRGVAQGTMLGSFINDSTSPANGFTDANVVTMLTNFLNNNSSVPAPVSGHNRFYGVIAPPGINNSISQFAGQHQSFVYNGIRAAYCWVDNPDSLTVNDSVTKVFSHELVEACTNPFVDVSNNGILVNGTGVTNDEIGDTCNNQTATIDMNGVQCTVQAYWSKQDNACVLPLGSLSFLINKNTFGIDEVQDAINNNGGVFSNAFWLALDDFSISTFNSFGITIPVPTGPLAGLSGISVTPSPQNSGDPVPAAPIPVYEDPGDTTTIQRIRFSFDIRFTTAATPPFPSSGNAQYALTATFKIGGTTVPGVNSQDTVNFELVAGADPYFSNIDPTNNSAVAYLSQDLRVFSVAQGQSALPADGLAPVFQSGQSGYDYIRALIGHLNGADTYTTPVPTTSFDPLNTLVGQSGYETGESSVTPVNGMGNRNFNFAIARVRLRSSVQGTAGQAANTRVFFRLWVAPSYDTDFDPYTTYPSNPAYPGLPTSPLPSSATLPPDPTGQAIRTTPFFATGAAGTNDYNSSVSNNNIQNIAIPTIAGRDSVWAYYGCFLDVYDSSNQAHYPGTHHCLVAQIASDDAPILYSSNVTTSPGNSDKLAQRNLQITLSGNPGPASTHRIPQAFDTRASLPFEDAEGNWVNKPDELMIDWGNTPPGSQAQIYWPQVSASEVISLAGRLYRTHLLSAADPHTITCKTVKGVTYVPVPAQAGKSFAGLLTVDLPIGVKKGQEFRVVIRRITTKNVRGFTGNQEARASNLKLRSIRCITGAFEVKIPVTTEDILLRPEENTLAIFKWRLEKMSPTYRWYPVLQRYIEIVSGRVDGAGGDSGAIQPSPTGIPLPNDTGGKFSTVTGKVCKVLFNCYGDFEGFEICSCGKEHFFPCCEKAIAELLLRACKERLLLTVCVEEGRPPRICGITVECC